jgi:hypothetical protein
MVMAAIELYLQRGERAQSREGVAGEKLNLVVANVTAN